MKSAAIIFCLSIIFFNQSNAQNNLSCKDDSLYKILDFWTGVWKVYDSSNIYLGADTVQKILDQCAVTESWRGADSNDIGKSLFYIDNSTHRWKQVWVTTLSKLPGGQKEKWLVFYKMGEQTIFEGQYPGNKKIIMDRTILNKINEKEVKQEIQYSGDGGLSWKSVFVAFYKK